MIDKNVYVLGAGFSRAAGLPLISDFLEMMRDVETQDQPERAQEAIRKVLEERATLSAVREKMRIDLDNIEELFSLFDAAAPPQSRYKLSDSGAAVRRAIAATLIATEKRVPEFSVDLARESVDRFVGAVAGARRADVDLFRAHAQVYDLFASLVVGKLESRRRDPDIVITFNYDTLVERALMRAGVGVDYGLKHVSYDKSTKPTDGSLSLIKLHGSINWAPPSGQGQKLRILGYDAALSATDYPVLIPPTWSKGVFAGVFQQLWANAVDALSRATRIVIVGYSFPATDQYFRYLLATSLRDNHTLRRFIIVDPRADALNVASFFDDIYMKNRLHKLGIGLEHFLREIPQHGHLLGRATGFFRN